MTALYAGLASAKPVQMHPLKSFKELPDSMPYQAALAANAAEYMPVDGLADVAEYTARRIVALLP